MRLEKSTQQGKPMNDLALMTTDGFAVQENSGASMIVGKMLKFSDGRFTVDKTETMPANTTLVAVGVITAWVRWADSRPSEHKVTQPGQSHPYRDELPDQDQTKWAFGLNGEPADPWRDTRYLHLIDPNTGADFTFISDSFGGRRAVGDLKQQIANVRSVHPAAVPLVQLASTMMKTRFGQKPRPDFKIVGWRGKQDDVAATRASKAAVIPAGDDMDDDIPF
jgi:hypothetical protein